MSETQVARSRTFTWDDPAVNASLLGQRSGLELLRAMVAGELPAPPVMHMLGMSALEVTGEGSVTVTLPVQEFHYNPLGSVHGGVLSALLDTATGCAVHSTLPAGVGYTTLDLTTKFLRPATMRSGELRCVGRVISRGRTNVLAEASVTDVGDRLIAHAISTCLLFPMEPPLSGDGVVE